MTEPAAPEPAASLLFDLGLAFWSSKVLLTAVELGVFTLLAREGRDANELTVALGLSGRGARDFFDALVILKLLKREHGRYTNTAIANRFLVRSAPEYVGGALDMANARLYPVWAKLTDALRSGRPQNEASADPDYYDNLSHHAERLRMFLRGMTGLSRAAASAIAQKFDWSIRTSFVDLGGAEGALAVEVARSHTHLHGAVFELPPIEPYFRDYVSSFGLERRLLFHGGDFFKDPLPTADVYVMGHVLHNWDLEQKRFLIKKVYDALPPRGVLIVYEALIDDQREENLFGLLMSLNMLLVTAGGFVFTGAECRDWMTEAGFGRAEVTHLYGPDSMVVGYKE